MTVTVNEKCLNIPPFERKSSRVLLVFRPLKGVRRRALGYRRDENLASKCFNVNPHLMGTIVTGDCHRLEIGKAEHAAFSTEVSAFQRN